MIFLLNPARVLLESLELARLKLAARTNTVPEKVTARLEVNDGKIMPVFQLSCDIAGALEKEYIEKLMRDIWKEGQPELIERLRGLLEVRYGCGPSKEAETGEDTQGTNVEERGGESVRGLDMR
jgi:hypothetical protein